MFGLSYPAGPLNNAGPYSLWVLMDVATGLIMFGAAWIMEMASVRRRAAAQEPGVASDGSEMVYDPTLLGNEVFADSARWRQESVAQTDSPLSLFIIRTVERRIDNAVLTRDLRARLRNNINATKVWHNAVVVIALSAIIVMWLPAVAIPVGMELPK